MLSILYNNNKKQVMASGTQFVISLNRLTIPSTSRWQRVTLSVVTPPLQYFIQNQKIVKGFKVNFYRQNLFIHEYSSDLCFNLYGISEENPRTLLKTFIPSRKQLQAVHKRPTLFQIQDEGYELVWDSWIFTEQSSYMNQESEKDYSELDLPFENRDPSMLSHILVNSQSQNSRFSKMMVANLVSKKRASSTEETSSVGKEGFQFSEGSENKIKQGAQVQKREKAVAGGRKKGSHVTSMEKKKKTHIKSHLYSYLVTGISELLSPAKA